MGILNWIVKNKAISSTIDNPSQDVLVPIVQPKNNYIISMATNGFESLWQPLLGWTAGFCVALYYIPQLIVVNLEWSMQVLETHQITPFPIDPSDILNLVYLLFGFGTYHLAKKKLLG